MAANHKGDTSMKKAAPFIRLFFLALFLLLLKQGFLIVWLGLYLLSLLFPLLWGKRLYCLLACPMNTLLSFLVKLKKKLGLKNRPAPIWLAGGWFVWASLALTVLVFILSRQVLKKDFPMMLVWTAVALLMSLYWHPDAFHDKVCPFGLPQGCLAKQSLLSPENREKARDYKGFTQSVLGGGQPGQGPPQHKP